MNWSDLQQWQEGPLSEQATVYNDKKKLLVEVGESLLAGVGGLTGIGQTVTSAKGALTRELAVVSTQASNLGALGDIASAAAEGVGTIRAAVEDAEAAAASNMLAIHADGSVSYVGPTEVPKGEAQRIRQLMQQLADRVADIMQDAQELVEQLRSRISSISVNDGVAANGATAGFTALASRATTKLPPEDATEEEVAQWWSSLSDKQKAQLIKDHPYEIGSLNGVDGTSRDKANRKVLKKELAKIETDRNEMMRENSQHPGSYGEDQFARLKERKRALEEVQKTLDKSEKDGMPRQLLSLDVDHNRVTAAVAQGNVDTAKHIGVIVPGMRTDVANDLDDYDDKASVMGANVRKHAHGEEVAMVSYLGYDAPQGVREAMWIEKAEEGAKGLSGFLNGLDASREHGAGDAHVTVAGHSYGSTTAGKALTMVNDGVVDDLIQFGSPGSGVQSVDEFHLEKGHAWVSAAPYREDMVQDIGDDGRFGKDPNKMPGYNHLSGEVGPPHDWFVPFSRHMSYFDEGCEALDDMSKVIAGRGEPRSTS